MDIAPLTKTILLTGMVLFGAPGWSQDNQEEQELVPKLYEVELIVFRHLDQRHNTPEIPPIPLNQPPPLNIEPAESIFLADDAMENDPAEKNPDGHDQSMEASSDPDLTDPDAEFPYFVMIDDESLEFNGVYRRLERLEAYEPLLHLGWIQPALGAADAIPYEIVLRMNEEADADFNPPEDLSGTITLYKERYLHLELDLALEPAPSAEFTAPVIHKLEESRRVREPSSHYFDHPRFGVIARIQLLDEAAESDDLTPGPG